MTPQGFATKGGLSIIVAQKKIQPVMLLAAGATRTAGGSLQDGEKMGGATR